MNIFIRVYIYNILAVRKVVHLNINTKMFDFGVRVLIGRLARVFASQPIKTPIIALGSQPFLLLC